jgi:hypothetical protein
MKKCLSIAQKRVVTARKCIVTAQKRKGTAQKGMVIARKCMGSAQKRMSGRQRKGKSEMRNKIKEESMENENSIGLVKDYFVANAPRNDGVGENPCLPKWQRRQAFNRSNPCSIKYSVFGNQWQEASATRTSLRA